MKIICGNQVRVRRKCSHGLLRYGSRKIPEVCADACYFSHLSRSSQKSRLSYTCIEVDALARFVFFLDRSPLMGLVRSDRGRERNDDQKWSKRSANEERVEKSDVFNNETTREIDCTVTRRRKTREGMNITCRKATRNKRKTGNAYCCAVGNKERISSSTQIPQGPGKLQRRRLPTARPVAARQVSQERHIRVASDVRTAWPPMRSLPRVVRQGRC